ncbi:hypothetical protein AGABI2DRAFT_121424 [Agaricus bisporus var. bisporus H97]|uniref:hypothetical protein n=1 Tax=Agaricus bisporus var. bisporus (strain H97 / ATCC MYA-4626 / FGSC 10389) TaxID=936046 RepID=UPI00029F6DAC|nr:hypothetical protein AGABI2DRAFT_121424 [Agaricus bisporus var. bisporus H97]EKV44245.1 hypothetical protein AGABI2DRAFT_121424 [Agaricus bisporus var. bisporus H97]
MDNNSTTLQGPLLLVTQIELVAPTTVAGTLYGIGFTLFCLYAHALVPRFQDKDRKRQAKFMLGYTSVIMLCGTYNLVINAWITQDAYIKHDDYPGGPYLYVLSTTQSQPALAVALSCQVLILIMTSAIQIWRVWVIWSATRYANLVIVLPSLCFLTFTALTFRTIILEIKLPVAEVMVADHTTSIVEFAFQGATTLLCTALISAYLVYQHWRQKKLIGEANGSAGYMKIVAILIESYALESAWLLIVAIISSHPESSFFGENSLYIEIIAYLLVQYRVTSGKSYESQREQRKISSLHWNHSNHATTQLEEASESSGHHPPKLDTTGLPVHVIA